MFLPFLVVLNIFPCSLWTCANSLGRWSIFSSSCFPAVLFLSCLRFLDNHSQQFLGEANNTMVGATTSALPCTICQKVRLAWSTISPFILLLTVEPLQVCFPGSRCSWKLHHQTRLFLPIWWYTQAFASIHADFRSSLFVKLHHSHSNQFYSWNDERHSLPDCWFRRLETVWWLFVCPWSAEIAAQCEAAGLGPEDPLSEVWCPTWTDSVIWYSTPWFN